jgi:hypothetical protein
MNKRNGLEDGRADDRIITKRAYLKEIRYVGVHLIYLAQEYGARDRYFECRDETSSAIKSVQYCD